MHQSMSDRFSALSQNIAKVKAVETSFKKRAEDCLKEQELYERKVVIYAKCLELFKQWMEDSVSKNID